jgi:hypothetical protein
MNGLDPNRMTADERLSELGDLLALGLVRLKARQSSEVSGDLGESSLDCSPDQSGVVLPKAPRRARA